MSKERAKCAQRSAGEPNSIQTSLIGKYVMDKTFKSWFSPKSLNVLALMEYEKSGEKFK